MMDRFDVIRARAREVIEDFETREHPLFDDASGSHRWLSEIAEKCFRLSVAENDRLPENVIGTLDRDIDSISFRPGMADGRRAFTIAHELGHFALDHPDRQRTDSETDIDESPDFDSLSIKNGVVRNYNSKDAFELEANVFAAELLAPSRLVRERIQNDPDWSIDKLANYFGLSRFAMLNQVTAALKSAPPVVDEVNAPAASLKPDPSHDRAVAVQAPALVMAGPGAGKTRILVRRYQRLVDDGFSPRRILALTFSNKAACEMRERLSKAMPDHAHEIAVFTFHSFGLELIRGYGQPSLGGAPQEPVLLNPGDLLMKLRTHLAKMPLGSFEQLPSPGRHLSLLLDAISRAKDELVSPRRFAELAKAWRTKLEVQPQNENTEKDRKEALKCEDAAAFYHAYEAWLSANNYLDYGDLIVKAVQILEDPLRGDAVRQAYDHILVDEFQDINYASGRMVQALGGAEQKVWAVGDVRQSIYRFRGASPANIARFKLDYPNAEIVNLDRNYRSVEDIVACGQAVDIPMRAEAKELPLIELISDRGRPANEPAVEFVVAPTAFSELTFLVNRVKEATETNPPDSIAVLTRTRRDAQRISDALEENGIATSYPGDLASSPIFKNIFAILLVATGDLRGIARTCSSLDFALSRDDLKRVLSWAVNNRRSARELLYDAAEGKVVDLSEAGKACLDRLNRAVGEIAAQPSPFHALATYLFQHSVWCRSLLNDDRPRARRSLGTVRAVCSVARSFYSTKSTPRERLAEFIEFVEACVEAQKLETVTPDTSDLGCVNVLTVHGSKGLEWSYVIVPCLTQGKFPSKVYHERTPYPEGLIANYDPADERAEEACLFYVAVTRARDRLLLCHAEQYGIRAKPSEFLEPVLTALDGRHFLRRTAAPLTADPSAEALATDGYKFDAVIPYDALRTFDSCPKQFEYRYVMGLSRNDRGYPRFHRTINLTADWLQQASADGKEISLDQLKGQMASAWDDSGPVGHWYEERYQEQALRLMRSLHGRISHGHKIEIRKKLKLRVNGREIGITVDEVEHTNPRRMRRLHYGRPATSHLGKDQNNHLPALLGALAAQEYPGENVEVLICYPLIDLEKNSLSTPAIIRNRTEKMGQLATSAEQGPYPATPGMMTCRFCDFNLICGDAVEED